MNATYLLGSLILLLPTCASAPAPTPEATADLQRARACLEAGDLDTALMLTDRLRKEQPRWTEVWLVAGEGNLRLAAMGRRGLSPEALFADAEDSFARAAALQPDSAQAQLGLAKARYGLAAYEAALPAALAAAGLYADGGKDAQAAQARLVAARCCLQQLAALRTEETQNGKPDQRGLVPAGKESLQMAQAALAQFAACQQELPADAYRGAAQAYQWLDQHDEAMRELESGIMAAPEQAELHIAYQYHLMQMGQQRALTGAYARFLRDNPGQPLLLWYRGRAEVVVADNLRERQNFQAAIDGYRKAVSSYEAYRAAVPAHADSANQWIAICELSVARCAVDMGDLASAQDWLFRAPATSAVAIDYDGMTPRLQDSFGSHFAGVVFAIGRALSSSADRAALEATLSFYDRVIERCPGRFGFVYNNAALPARDLGVLLARDLDGKSDAERQQALTAAMELWERSYRYYEEATRLSPEDPRIQNDCGLMLIYHLGRDYGRARELFLRAIEVGQPQLDALPQDGDASERQFLEEAIGDAWQNLGVLTVRCEQQPFEKAKAFLENAVRYYPYQQREAAFMLQNQGMDSGNARLNPRSLQGVQNAGAQRSQGNEKELTDKARAKAEAAEQDGDLDTALAELDKANRELKDYGPFQALRGDYSLRYARQALQAGRKGADLMFQDAVAILKRAVELDSEPNAPRLMLAQAQYEAGDLAAASATVSALLLHMQSQGGGEEGLVKQAHAVRANASSRHFIANKDDPAARPSLEEARISYRYLEQKGALDAEARRTWATLETWAGAAAQAVAVYARGLAQAPEDQTLLAAVVDTAYAAGEPGLAVEALKGQGDAAGLWYLGRARFLLGASLRATGKLDEALAELETAKKDFARSMQQNSSYRDSCEQWIAICTGKQGNALLAKKEWAKAEETLLAAVRMRPDRINDDLGLQETTKIGVMVLADHYARGGDLGKTEQIYRAATAHAHSDLDLLNNEGLFARDHGNQLERAGKKDEAMALYEESYKAYSRAAELDPSNVRLRNDRALIAIHYLERDWDENRELLERAAKDGEQQLEDFPKSDVQGRQTLDEALGDCYENLALWHLKHGGDAAAAKAAAEQSLLHHPGKMRPGARRHLAEANKLLQEKEGK